jgi:hypothetical protein
MMTLRVLLIAVCISVPLGLQANDQFREAANILERHCLSCHEGAKPKGGLSLVNATATLAGGESGPAIVPGKPDKSLLVDYISGNSPEMPKDAKPLAAEEIETIRRWIAAGAVWPKDTTLVDKKQNSTDWWSLKPLVRPEVPKVKDLGNSNLVRNQIDAFVVAKLTEQKLSPSPEADRRTLIRRLYYDLIGLPPAPEDVATFIADQDPQAYKKLVDKLLAMPQYGERWGRHWLDVVHYGDTHGYDKDQPRPTAWPYRDYVIRTFNEDKPYGRFVEEQAAGDTLFPGTADGYEAMGFISAGPWDLIGHVEVPESKIDGKIARMLDRDDMVSNTMNTFTSTTVQCARCHNHKFDPVTQDDYYSLTAVFAALDRAERAYDTTPEAAARRTELETQQTKLSAAEKFLRDAIAKRAGSKLEDLNQRIAALEKLKPGQPSRAEAYGYHSSISPKADVEKWVQVDLGQAIALSNVVLHPCSDDFAGIGDGFGFPVRFKVEVSNDVDFKTGVTAIGEHTQADFKNPRLAPVTYSANGQAARYVRVTATQLAHRRNDYIFALAELSIFDTEQTNVSVGAKVTSLDSIEAPPRWRKVNLTDRYYPGAGLSGDPDALDRLRAEHDRVLNEATDSQTRDQLVALEKDLASVKRSLEALPPQKKMFTATIHKGTGAFRGTGNDGGKPREIHVLSRGDVRNPLHVVGPGVPPLMEGAAARFDIPHNRPEGERRAALAHWLTDKRNPLTWRSIVNRVWQYHFGRGIVDTANDFGRMGGKPSHPELLDWLAVEFRDGGQSLKSLHRLICNSSAYRQTSADDAAKSALDGSNMYLWRMNRRRLEAEALRDSVLQVSGKLDLKMGGPGFQDFVIEHPAHSPHYEYKLFDPENPACHRRGVYRFIVRSQPQPFLTTLDCADPSMSVDKRNESMTALQSLALLNNKLMVVMAKHFAERLAKEAPDLPGQIARGVQLCLGRPPTEQEQERLTAYAKQFGLTNTCRLLFNLNEFTFVD